MKPQLIASMVLIIAGFACIAFAIFIGSGLGRHGIAWKLAATGSVLCFCGAVVASTTLIGTGK